MWSLATALRCKPTLVLLACTFVLSLSRWGRADAPASIPTVNLLEAGPDKEFPTSGAFYLAGTAAADVTAIRPVFVRISFPSIFGSRSESCSTARKGLHELRTTDGKPQLTLFIGKRVVEDVWTSPTGPDGDSTEYRRLQVEPILVPSPWTRPPPAPDAEPKTAPYQVLVDEPRFFQSGASYCLFVYFDKTEFRSDTTLVATKLWEQQLCRDECAAPRSPADCTTKCATALMDEVKKLGQNAGVKVDLSLDRTIRGRMIPSVATLVELDAAATRALSPAKLPPFIASPWEPPRTYLQVSDHPLARMIVDLLADKGTLQRTAFPARNTGDVVDGRRLNCPPRGKDDCAARVEYSTRDGKIVVRYVLISSRLDEVEVSSSAQPKPGDAVRLALAAGALKLGGDSTSLDDVLQLARGRITHESTQLLIKLPTVGGQPDVYTKIVAPSAARARAALKSASPVATPTEAAGLAERTSTLHALVGRACSAAKQVESAFKPPPDDARFIGATEVQPTSVAALSLAGRWLDKEVLGGCGGSGETVLRDLDVALKEHVNAARQLEENRKTLKLTWVSVQTRPTKIAASMSRKINQQTYFDQYVTTVVGRVNAFADVSNFSGGAVENDFGVTYAGAQIYLFPNDVAEPMWVTNGAADIRRVFAFEIGLALDDSYGAGGRLRGLGPLPPLLTGGAFQLLPYLTLSTGIGWFAYRQSTLGTETTRLRTIFYLGAAAEINLIGIVRSQFTEASGSVAKESK